MFRSWLVPGEAVHTHVEPAPGTEIDPKSLEITRIDVDHPFHPFSVFDTVTLADVACGQTVPARAVQAAGFPWDAEEAHSALYDAEQTAKLFCTIVNAWPAR